MNILILFFDLLLTLPLSFIIIYSSQKGKKYLYNLLLPTIYIIIISAIWPQLKSNIFLIPIFELFIRNFYITNIKDEYNDNKKDFIYSILSIIISTIIYNIFISKVNNVLPQPEEFKSLLWFLIIIFIYLYFADSQASSSTTHLKSLFNKKEYVVMQYAKFKTKYGNIVNSKNEKINLLTYAIMIHENYQHPVFYRNISSYLNHLLNKKNYYGIMCVSSPMPISDEESIKIVLDELEKNLKKEDLTRKNIEQYLKKENELKKNEIMTVYEYLQEFIKE